MKSVMLDLETLAAGPGAAVTSIGVAAFDDQRIIASGGIQISAADWHGRIDPETVKWWLQQTPEAQRNTFFGTTPAKKAAEQFASFMKEHGGDELWANDPSFDCVILRQWWERTTGNNRFPSHFRDERSCRTIFAEAKRAGISLESAWVGGTAHSAESDAVCQAKAVILARQGLAGLNLL